ncbi:NYN domain-containing protein [Burkholderia sp. Ac-20365]|uniref:NYN domain-containing protein n=1 Tax=Burkholderia sp. Ac-20365 TaxID=2703897 RepID=UPI00197B9988|nr:NYN domain-containing protein [Burkholderia sp. Ac-20365]MBN3761335.1 NYN domain-containing protein [Burkholderia sp. Ac-20365]
MSSASNTCCIFLDHSNIFGGARKMAVALEGESTRHAVRLHYDSLIRLASAGRIVTTGVCAGSIRGAERTPPGLTPTVRQSLAASCIEVEVYERSENTHTEQAVDQAIQVHMLRALADQPPGVAVLLTGDGSGYQYGKGFRADLERMHRQGWGIELLAWNTNCNRYMRDWAADHGCFIPLDNYYYTLTYIKEQRELEDLISPERPVASPCREGRCPPTSPASRGHDKVVRAPHGLSVVPTGVTRDLSSIQFTS